MAINERQNEILRTLKESKTASVNALAKALYVSEATIRRDLAEMKSMGLIERSHGGAILPENAEEISIFFRMEKNANEKERAATKALPHIPPFKSLFIDSSSTALALAERLDLSFKTVVTNNLQTALQLAKKPNINLIILGGSVQNNTNSASGSWTARQLNDFSFDLMISSCASVLGKDVYESSIETKEVKRAAFDHCKRRLLISQQIRRARHLPFHRAFRLRSRGDGRASPCRHGRRRRKFYLLIVLSIACFISREGL